MTFETVTKVVTKEANNMTGAAVKATARKHLTDIGLKALKPGEKVTDPLPGRGSGSILFKCRDSGVIEGYYRRRGSGDDQLIKLGIFKKAPKNPGLSLSELREQAAEYAKIATEHGDIKAYLARCNLEKAEQEAERQRQRNELQRLAELEASKGSLSELFQDYIEDRKRDGRSEAQIKEFKRVLLNELEGVKVGPDGAPVNVMAMKAKDVRPDHVKLLLRPIWERGATRQAGKVRSFLVAAFNFGLRAEHHIDRSSQKSYGLEINPADPVVVPNTSKPGERALNDAELKQLWETITQVKSIGPIMARAFRFAIATAGQRPGQFIREPWASYNLKNRYVKIIDSKGRGGIERLHYVPLTDTALQILKEVRAMQPEGALYPWSVDGKTPIHSASLSHAIKDWLGSPHARLGSKKIKKFTPRDLRRTCTQFMQRNGIKDPDSDLLQSHGQTGVVAKHYRNNPEAKLPEMRRTMAAFNKALGKMLTGSKHKRGIDR